VVLKLELYCPRKLPAGAPVRSLCAPKRPRRPDTAKSSGALNGQPPRIKAMIGILRVPVSQSKINRSTLCGRI